MIGLYLAVATTVLVAGFAGGVKYQSGVAARAELARVEAAAKTLARQADRIEVAAVKNEEVKEATRIKFVTITKEVDRVIAKNPIFRNICLDDDGLRQLATATRESPSASEPVTPVPATRQPN